MLAIKELSDTVEGTKRIGFGANENVYPKVYSFSDNFAICIEYDEYDFYDCYYKLGRLVDIAQRIQCKFMSVYQLLIRGSIATGKLYLKNNLIYGEGLINAYLLESNYAIYPRIIISDDTLNKFVKKGIEEVNFFDKTYNDKMVDKENVFNFFVNTLSKCISEIEENEVNEKKYEKQNIIKFKKDFDGKYFVDCLQCTYEFSGENYVEDLDLHAIIEEYVPKTIKTYFRYFYDDIHVIKKLLWCCDYINNFFEENNKNIFIRKDELCSQCYVNFEKISKILMRDLSKNDCTKEEKVHISKMLSIIENL